MDFSFRSYPANVHFGLGQTYLLKQYCEAIGAEKILLVCSKSGVVRYQEIPKHLGNRYVALFDRVESHCPQPIIEQAVTMYQTSSADTVVAVGGGSTLGLGKILKAEYGAKFIAIPTTYSGSEMTPIYGRKIDGQKKTRIDIKAIPDLVIYDPEITVDLPAHQTAATGMNSLAHAVEALYPATPNPIAFDLASKAIGLHASALPVVVKNPYDISARTDALYAGFLGGLLVSMVGVALHHALGHVLGGLFELEHGDYNSAVLPHVMAYNAPAAKEAANAICKILGTTDPGTGLFELAQSIDAPTSLATLGMPASGVEEAAMAIVKKAPRNPREINIESMTHVLSAAYSGEKPLVSHYI